MHPHRLKYGIFLRPSLMDAQTVAWMYLGLLNSFVGPFDSPCFLAAAPLGSLKEQFMILDTLSNSVRYEGLGPRFAKAFQWLRSVDPSSLPDGRTDLDDDFYVDESELD